MADVSIDRYGINITVDTDEILNNIDDTDLAQMVIDRSIVDEVLDAIEESSLESVLDRVSDKALSVAASNRGIFTLEYLDTDELLEELRQRNAMPGIPKDITDILLKANQMLFEYNNGIFTPEEG